METAPELLGPEIAGLDQDIPDLPPRKLVAPEGLLELFAGNCPAAHEDFTQP